MRRNTRRESQLQRQSVQLDVGELGGYRQRSGSRAQTDSRKGSRIQLPNAMDVRQRLDSRQSIDFTRRRSTVIDGNSLFTCGPTLGAGFNQGGPNPTLDRRRSTRKASFLDMSRRYSVAHQHKERLINGSIHP